MIGELDFILGFHWSMSVPCPFAFPELARSAQYVPLNIDINELNKDYYSIEFIFSEFNPTTRAS